MDVGKDIKEKKIISYEKLLSKARKLKALADRGIEEEKESAKRFYKDFIDKHGISEGDINPEHYNRVFRIKSREYEVLLSHIILSVNPYININKKRSEYKVVLDDADYVEVIERVDFFYRAFNKEKELFFSAFMDRFGSNFLPDEESVAKHSQTATKMSEAGQQMNDKRSDIPKTKSDPSDRISDAVLSAKAPEVKPLIGRNAQKFNAYKKCFDSIIYIKSNRRLNGKGE